MTSVRIDARVAIALGLAAALVPAAPARAELTLGTGAFDATFEAYANVTAGAPDRGDDERGGLRADGALRALGLLDISGDVQIGGRGVLAAEADRDDDDLSVVERSVLVVTDYGRFEYGRRMGLPDVLTGYAPNPYTFTTAEYGPSSGQGLDPGGTLPTRFLPPALARQIDAIAGLGVSSSGFGDLSDKFLYVSPKHRGLLGALAYAPHVADAPDRRDLLQSGLVHESYSGRNVYRVGGSYTYGAGRDDARDLHSLSLGAAAVLDDAWEIGASSTYDGKTGLRRSNLADAGGAAYGFAASINHNLGAWTFGGYAQWARSAGDVDAPGNDLLRAASLGGSWRPNAAIRFYSAWYGYRFDDDGGDFRRGSVWLLGVRWSA